MWYVYMKKTFNFLYQVLGLMHDDLEESKKIKNDQWIKIWNHVMHGGSTGKLISNSK